MSQRLAFYGITYSSQSNHYYSVYAELFSKKLLVCGTVKPCTEMLKSILLYLQFLSVIPGLNPHIISLLEAEVGPKADDVV